MVIQLLCVVAEGGGGFEPGPKTAGPSLEEQIDSPGRPSSPMTTAATMKIKAHTSKGLNIIHYIR